MNKIFRIIWNSTLNSWVVASELAKGKVKSKTAVSSTSFVQGINKKLTVTPLAALIAIFFVSTNVNAVQSAQSGPNGVLYRQNEGLSIGGGIATGNR